MSAVEVHPGILAERERWRRGDWRPMEDAPRDGSLLMLLPAESQGEVSYLGRWSTHYSIHGLGGCWTGADGWGTDGDLHLCGWRPASHVALLPAVPPAELRVGDVVDDGDPEDILLVTGGPYPVCDYGLGPAVAIEYECFFRGSWLLGTAYYSPDKNPLRVLREPQP